MYAATLLDERLDSSTEAQLSETESQRRRPMAILAAGLALFIVGGGFLLLVPAVGLMLIVFALIGLIWDVVIELGRNASPK